jgi:DNA-binding HxlR family transcriptional regulator
MKMKLHTRSNEEKKEPRGNGHSRANPVEGCPLTAAVAAIGGKWKLIIVYWLRDRPRHFAGLRRRIPGISQKVLTEQLRQLMHDGIVARHPTGAIPSPVEYELTEYGRSLLPIVEAIRAWGRGHLGRQLGDDQMTTPKSESSELEDRSGLPLG